ncbi:MAG: PAS domain S-box protein [Planctomycetota bacterium]|nr:PAS domain S-box protein [Planctomycetota bacterium]
MPWWTWVLPALVCHAGTWLSLSTKVATGVSAVYLPIPLALIMACWWGPRVLPGLYLNALLCAPLWDLPDWRFRPLYALPETVAVGLGWWLFARLGKGRCWLPDLGHLMRFVLLAIVPAALMNGFYVAGQLVLLGDLRAAEFWKLGVGGFEATFLDGLAIAPAFGFLLTPWLERKGWTRTRGAASTVLVKPGGLTRYAIFEICQIFVAIFIISRAMPMDEYWSVYGIFIVWAAVRHGVWLAVLANVWLVFATLIFPSVGSMHGMIESGYVPAAQMTMAILCLAGLIASRTVSDQNEEIEQRRRAEKALKESEASLNRALEASQNNELALRESEERLRLLFEGASDGIFLATGQGRYLEVNPAGLALLGYTREEMLARSISDILAPGEERRLDYELAQLKGPNPVQSEWRLRRKDGAVVHVEINAGMLPDGKVLAMVRDVSARKKVEADRARLMHDLGERIKELIALHKTARLLQQDRPFDEGLLRDLVAFLPPAWNHPDVCEARIRIGSLEVATPRWWETPWMQSAEFSTRDGKRGRIEVAYLEERPAEAEGPFLAEERTLIESLRDMLVAHYDRRMGEKAIQDLEARERQLNERFELAADSAGIGVWDLDLQTNKLVWDARMFKLYGVPPEKPVVAYEDWATRVHPDDLERARSEVKLAIMGLKAFDTSFRIVVNDGEVRHLKASARVIKDAAGNPARMTGINYDITDSRKASEALAANEKLLREFIRHAPAAIAMLDNQLRYIQASDRWIKDYHLDGTEIIGRSHYEVFPDIPERWKKIHQHVLAGAVESCDEDPFPREDGTVDWLQWEARPWYKPGGGIGGLIFFTQVITERKRAAQALQESESRLSAILENSPNVAIQGYDLQGRVLFWNKASEQVFGFTSKEALGTTLSKLTRSGQQEQAFLAMLKEVAQDGRPKGPYECGFKRKDGREGVSVSTLFRIPTPDNQGMFVSMDVDVTERWVLENQLQHAQKMESIGRLAGGVAHDFNNLLTGIIGYSDLILADPASHPRRRNVEEIRKIGVRAGNLTRQLLSFSRKQAVEPKLVDLNLVVGEMKNMLGRLIEGGIDLRFELIKEETHVIADPSQIEQILLNLVVNARDASSGSGRILVRTLRQALREPYLEHGFEAPAGTFVGMSVSDKGSGMSPEIIHHIFEPYFTTKPMGKGTGLGLSMVFGIVKKMNGFVAIESAVGQGSTFKVMFPAAGAKAAPVSSEVTLSVSTGQETILLVDDEETILDVASSGLRARGYQVLTARTPDAALETARVHDGPIHLLVTDVVLPKRSGTLVAEGVRAHRPEIKVLFTSGYTEDETVLHGVSQRSINFLEKPFTIEELCEKIRYVLATTSSASARP